MNPPPDLNRLASLYRWMEWTTFGPWLSWCRQTYLNQMLSSRRALILGDGDGRFTARLLRTNPHVQIDAVDASTAMLRALIERAGPHARRVRAHLADIRLWEPANPPYDLVVTHFFLDFLTTEEVLALATRLRSVVTPETHWVVSEFAVPQTRIGRSLAQPVVDGLYFGFRHLTGLAVRRLPDHRGALRNAGFALRTQRQRLGGLLVSELWAQHG